jgi:hypothetical protein
MPQFSIALWARYESLSSQWGEWYIFWGDGSTAWLGIGTITPQGLTNPFLSDVWGVGANYNVTIEPKPIYTTYLTSKINTWCAYCLVYKYGTMYAYKDGILIATKVQTVNVGSVNGGIARHWWNSNSGTSTRLNGSVDDVRIYNRALTEQEISVLSQ